MKIGMVGAGAMALRFLNNVKNEVKDVKFVTVYDINKSQLDKFSKTHPEIECTTDYSALLSNPELDAVYISTPVFTHSSLTNMAANAGKHILCEKPMALNMNECEEMVNTAEENGVILQIGYMMRFHPIHQYVKKEISRGNLGKIQYAHAERTIFFDYASQELPEHRKWYLDKTKSGGGAFMDLGSHVVDLILYLINDNVDKINFEANLDPKLGIDLSGLGTLKFKGGAVASIFAGWQTPLHDNVLKIYGDKATFYAVKSIGPYKDGYLELITSDNRKRIDIPYENHYILELKHFRDCVVNGTSCITSGKNCLQTERIRINMYNLI